MEALHQTIGLRVIGSGRLVSEIEEMAKVEPEGRCELRKEGRKEGRNAESGNPCMDESRSTVGGAVEARGIASGQREVQSMTVRR